MTVINKENNHPAARQNLTVGQKAADNLTSFMGSWFFILIFIAVLVIWMLINGYYLIRHHQADPFDPYPFILLNLVLSCLAAIQAPIILMSQNRESQKDRIRSEYDYAVNRKAEREISLIQSDLSKIKNKLRIKR